MLWIKRSEDNPQKQPGPHPMFDVSLSQVNESILLGIGCCAYLLRALNGEKRIALGRIHSPVVGLPALCKQLKNCSSIGCGNCTTCPQVRAHQFAVLCCSLSLHHPDGGQDAVALARKVAVARPRTPSATWRPSPELHAYRRTRRPQVGSWHKRLVCKRPSCSSNSPSASNTASLCSLPWHMQMVLPAICKWSPTSSTVASSCARQTASSGRSFSSCGSTTSRPVRSLEGLEMTSHG